MAVDFFSRVRALLPQLPVDAARIVSSEWAESGSFELALAELRRHARYPEFFPGNRLPDGSTRLSEADFFSTVQGYRDALTSVGVTPQVLLTDERIRRLVESGTSAGEFTEQVQALDAGVTAQGSEVIEGFARLIGVDPNLSRAALFGAAFDEAAPDGTTRTPAQLAREIGAAQVSAEASRFGFGFLDRARALRFQGIGLGQEDARKVFGEAARQLPRLNDLIQRFDDPSDPLDLESFTDAVVLRSPEELRTVERLFARQRAQFSPGTLFPLGRGDEGIAALRG